MMITGIKSVEGVKTNQLFTEQQVFGLIDKSAWQIDREITYTLIGKVNETRYDLYTFPYRQDAKWEWRAREN